MTAELGSTATAFSARRRSARVPHAWRRARRSRAACTVRNERAVGRRERGNARRRARFPFNPDPAWKTARVRRLSTAASGACRPLFQRGWTRRTRPRRAEGPPQGSRSTATSPKRPYAGSACTRHVLANLHSKLECPPITKIVFPEMTNNFCIGRF
jgi:hypothetical protein